MINLFTLFAPINGVFQDAYCETSCISLSSSTKAPIAAPCLTFDPSVSVGANAKRSKICVGAELPVEGLGTILQRLSLNAMGEVNVDEEISNVLPETTFRWSGQFGGEAASQNFGIHRNLRDAYVCGDVVCRSGKALHSFGLGALWHSTFFGVSAKETLTSPETTIGCGFLKSDSRLSGQVNFSGLRCQMLAFGLSHVIPPSKVRVAAMVEALPTKNPSISLALERSFSRYDTNFLVGIKAVSTSNVSVGMVAKTKCGFSFGFAVNWETVTWPTVGAKISFQS